MAPLEDLLVDENELDREALAAGLKEYVRVGQGTGGLRPAEKWSSLKQKGKVIAVVLGAKAAHVLGRRPVEGVTSSEIEELSGVAGGTVRPVLRNLVGAHLLEQDEARRYYVPSMCVPQALKVMNE